MQLMQLWKEHLKASNADLCDTGETLSPTELASQLADGL